MGRPWWYDDYWKQERKSAKGQIRLPKRPFWIWIVILALSLLLATSSTGFKPVILVWLVGFIHYFCRILVFIIFIRAVLSWFIIARTNIFVVLLDTITEPILSPLRRIIPRLGSFDITPLVAIVILYLIPIISRLLLI
jgi:YggT family protein